jgi:hypothetical protein
VRSLDTLGVANRRQAPKGVVTKECVMPDKSPKKPVDRKVGKSLKEKRDAKKQKKERRPLLGR